MSEIICERPGPCPKTPLGLNAAGVDLTRGELDVLMELLENKRLYDQNTIGKDVHLSYVSNVSYNGTLFYVAFQTAWEDRDPV